MQTEINGHSFSLVGIDPDESAVEFIRDRAKLTGTKLVCGAGVCGACTILVDNVPMTSCLLPAHALNGRSIQTIEAHTDQLHPVQKAFMACDGLQCGFCTPGFINTGIAFYQQWRATHGVSTPPREEIVAALAGHLCRCGAYVGILDAMQAACAGRFDDLEDDAEALLSPRVEAIEKVTGRAKYTVDIHYPGQLEGRILRSPHPHAAVLVIDSRAALALPGVKAVVELLDPERVVRYVGQEIAAVAAVDSRTAEAALTLIEVTYAVRPAVIGIDAARRPDAPIVYPGWRKKAPSAAEGLLVPGRWQGNVREPLLAVTNKSAGKARKLIQTARDTADPRLVEGTWRTTAQSHTTLEPHACVARWEDKQHLTVHLSTQACDLAAREIGEHFNLPAKNVRVRCEHVGGAFGAKVRVTSEAIAAIMLAKAAGAPVRVVLDRLEELTVGGFRPAAEIQLALLADKNGAMQALTAAAYADAGVAIGSQLAVMMGFIYTKSARELIDRDVVNHTPPGKPFRGPGGPLACWALEQAVDEMAHRLGEDPLALRQRWDDHALRQQLYALASRLPIWQERAAMSVDKGRFRRGIGVAAANWYYFFHSDTQIEVRTGPAGITVQTATQDMGNGSRTVIANAVAEVFGLPPSAINVQIGDSQTVRGPLSAGSRTTNSVFWPAQCAAQRVRDDLIVAAMSHFGWPSAGPGAGGIEHAGEIMPWAEVVKVVPPQQAVVKRGRDAGLPALPLAFGADDLRTGRGTTGAVHIIEVEVDTRLGKIRPLRVWAGLAAGKVIAPVLARSQCYGAVIQGLGYALYEAKQIDAATGHALTGGLEDYRIPGIGDTPEIEIHFVEEGFAHARGAGVGLSELATLPVAAATGNAIFHATGWRPYQLPILPAYIVQGLG